MRPLTAALAAVLLALAGSLGCGASAGGGGGGGGGGEACAGVDCSGHGSCTVTAGAPRCRCDPGYVRAGETVCEASQVPAIGGCAVLPADHLFNTPIDDLPVHPSSATFLATIGSHRIHLDLGSQTDPSAEDFYGIPYNVVSGESLAWSVVDYTSPDTDDMTWDPRRESDCAVAGAGGARTLVSPCTLAAAPTPIFPVPPGPLVEGGLSTAADHLPYGDHHLLLLDADACRLWELYHVYRPAADWQIFGSAGFDLGTNVLRPDGWTSADAAGFPILPLLLRADEAAAGAIHHALRFTILSSKIRVGHAWPARHDTTNGGSSAAKPLMGQLFRLKASYAIPASFGVQSRAILQAMKTYGMYVADGGSDLYVTGAPSAAWDPAILDEVQSVSSDQFEAVDLSPIRARSGFDPDSARVPP